METKNKCKFCNVDLDDGCQLIMLSPYRTVKICVDCAEHLKQIQENNPHFDFGSKTSKLLTCTVTVKDIDLFKKIVDILKKCYDIAPDEIKKDILECLKLENE